MPLKRGLIQVYTGDGKGKTTAALGLAFRAAEKGLKVIIVQFLKGRQEKQTISKIKNINLYSFGQEKNKNGSWYFVAGKKLKKNDIKAIREGLKLVEKIMGKTDVLILDEINVAIDKGLIETGRIIKMLKKKPKSLEIILTGRNANKKIIELADLVTEMKKIKHPFDRGTKARKGIEY